MGAPDASSEAGPAPASSHRGLTAVAGLKVGHAQMAGRPTGCTVILCGEGAVASVDVRGGAPATRETDLLDPANLVERVHAIVLAGGSAFGLDAAGGVMRHLEQQGIGFDAGVARVPIVPAACLFDLAFGGDPSIRPDADCGRRAALAANDAPVAEGNVGAGAGATVGKLAGPAQAMKGGLGSSAIEAPSGLVVAALVAVNAFGDVIDPGSGQVIAGARAADGHSLLDARRLLGDAFGAGDANAPGGFRPGPGRNTTIGVVATNARLTKSEACKLARMAHDGYARAISPVHTPYDGDAIFALATGRHDGAVDLLSLGALAAEAMAQAIVRAVRASTALGGLPAARDLP